jgi:C1A family cysteine protease
VNRSRAIPPVDLIDRARQRAIRPRLASARLGVVPRPDPTAPAFDWRDRGVIVAPEDQQTLGVCWAFATAGAIDAAFAIEHDYRVAVSEQDLLDHSGAGTAEGGWWAFDYAEKVGVALLEDDPYLDRPGGPEPAAAQRIKLADWGYVDPQGATPGAPAIKAALCRFGPLAVALHATPALRAYRGGIFAEPSASSRVDHGALLVGWDDASDTYTLKNSWGPDWGEGGFVRIARGSNGVGFGAAWVQSA